VLGTRNEEPEKPDQEKHDGNDPQDVERETGTREDQNQEQYQQDQAHPMSPLRITVADVGIRILPIPKPLMQDTLSVWLNRPSHAECSGSIRIVDGRPGVNHPIG
jgi:hypothetical protein